MAKLNNIVIIMNPDRFGDLRNAIKDLGISGMTVTHVEGVGTQMGHIGYYRGTAMDMSLLPKTKVEVVVPAELTDTIVDKATEVLHTGEIGVGKIFVYDVEHIYRVRTGQMDEEALKPENK